MSNRRHLILMIDFRIPGLEFCMKNFGNCNKSARSWEFLVLGKDKVVIFVFVFCFCLNFDRIEY